MIHLKYKCKVNFVKLPLIWIDLCLKFFFSKMSTPAAKQAADRLWTALVGRCSFRWLIQMRSAAFKMRPSNASRVTTFTLACVTDYLQWTKPWTVDVWHISKKFLKMPPPTSMHLCTRCRVLSVARRSSWRRSFIRTQALLMRATRSAHVSTLVRYISPFSHPHKQKSKGVKSGERAGQWIRLPRPIHRLGYVLFRCWVTFLV